MVQQIVDAINASVCRSTGMRPDDVTYENAATLRNSIYPKRLMPSKKTARLQLGDLVRVARRKQVFEKSYLPNFSDELFEVCGVRNRKGEPEMYQIKKLRRHCAAWLVLRAGASENSEGYNLPH